MKKENGMFIKITNKGAVMGIHMISTSLIQLLDAKRFDKVKTVEDLKNSYLEFLNKHLVWLDRKDDNTVSAKEIKQAKKIGNEVIKMIETLWNKDI